jgi:hypothetical protein
LGAFPNRKDGTITNRCSWTWVSADVADRLGPFIPHPTTTMGLDNFPRHCPCGQRPVTNNTPDHLTHPEDAPCPFATDNFPIGMLGNCCSLRGKLAAHNLEALGEMGLAGAMYRDMTAEDAIAFARALRDTAGHLERLYADQPDKPKGAGVLGTWDAKRRDWIWQNRVPFDQALTSIREAARWYEKVGRLGFGVYAWY